LETAEKVFGAFAIAAFLKFVLFSVFETRYLLAIWKARRPQAFAGGWAVTNREISNLYARFCMSSISTMCTSNNKTKKRNESISDLFCFVVLFTQQTRFS
jgi:hypothetical protein